MTIIDADSHFWEPIGWLADASPELDGELRDALPPQNFAEVIFGEVLAEFPAPERKAFLEGLPERMQSRVDAALADPSLPTAERQRRFEESPLGEMVSPKGAWRVDERIGFCDEHGIDAQLVSPTTTLGLYQNARRNAPDLLNRLCETYNGWACEQLAEHRERLLAVTLTNFADPDWAIAELERSRAAGSCAFLLPLYPVAGKALSHTDHEPIWAAAVDLGMIPVLHVANGSVVFDPAWTNTGRAEAGKNAFRLASSLNAQIPQVPLGDLILNGVFERHPALKVLCSEFGLSWVPGWLDKLGPVSRDGTPNIGILLGWPLKDAAVDIVKQHVLFSPLKGQRVDELIDVLGAESVVFATDFPHPEGSANAVAEFEAQLSDRFDEPACERFFGGVLGDVLAAGR